LICLSTNSFMQQQALELSEPIKLVKVVRKTELRQ
jgi:hypothetical protein